MKRSASAQWKGSIKEGRGTLNTDSGILDQTPYSFTTRFADEKGTNPEELIAASHAGCFVMALSKQLSDAGATVNQLDASCTISMDISTLTISKSHLKLEADVDGLPEDDIVKAINGAKENCPISKLLDTEIVLDYTIK